MAEGLYSLASYISSSQIYLYQELTHLQSSLKLVTFQKSNEQPKHFRGHKRRLLSKVPDPSYSCCFSCGSEGCNLDPRLIIKISCRKINPEPRRPCQSSLKAYAQTHKAKISALILKVLMQKDPCTWALSVTKRVSLCHCFSQRAMSCPSAWSFLTIWIRVIYI